MSVYYVLVCHTPDGSFSFDMGEYETLSQCGTMATQYNAVSKTDEWNNRELLFSVDKRIRKE